MKQFLISISVIVSTIILISCGGAKAPTYQPPLYKTIQKSLTIENIVDERTNQDHAQEFTNIPSINQLLVNRFMQAQIFQRVNSASKSTYSDDYTLSTKLIDYGMDKSMSFWTVFPDALFAAAGVGVGIALNSGYFAGVMIGSSAVDFLINGWGGRRLYDHDYIVSMNFDFKNKEMKSLWKDTLSYKISIRYTHWYLDLRAFGGGGGSLFYSNNPDYINQTALDYLVDIVVADTYTNIGEIVGSSLSYFDKKSYDNVQKQKYVITTEGMVCIVIERIFH
ncbi:MAG: hypothetical protein HW421_2469 [Ignavibacteria bacterium]|nr:hypothetical protein [Ignavibacteria bacterium]